MLFVSLFLFILPVLLLGSGAASTSDTAAVLRIQQAQMCSPHALMQLINATVPILIEPSNPVASDAALARFLAFFTGILETRVPVCHAYARASVATLGYYSIKGSGGDNSYQPQPLEEYVAHCSRVLAATDDAYLRATAAAPDVRLSHDDPYVACMRV